MNCKTFYIILFFVAFIFQIKAQGYQKDSLQIKVYTEIAYTNFKSDSVRVTKVFCDYCSNLQSEKIKEEAMRIAYRVRYSKENIVPNGIKKLAMYIRVSKKDFAALKEDEPDN